MVANPRRGVVDEDAHLPTSPTNAQIPDFTDEQFSLQEGCSSCSPRRSMANEVRPAKAPRLLSSMLVPRDLECFNCSPDGRIVRTFVRRGELYQLLPGGLIVPTTFTLHLNGISWKPSEGSDKEVQTLLFSPFLLLRICRVILPEQPDPELSRLRNELRMFKLTHTTAQSTLFFCVRDTSATDDLRADWVHDIVTVLRLCTLSMFPKFIYRICPIEDIGGCERRLMAGYMARRFQGNQFIMLYGDLRGPDKNNENACLILFTDETCRQEYDRVQINEQFRCHVYPHVGIQSSLFAIENEWFAVRSGIERNAWVRAVSNVQIAVGTGSYTGGLELGAVRAEISEHLDHLDKMASEFPQPSGLFEKVPVSVCSA